MAFSGLDVGIQESVLLLCAIVIGGVICSIIFLQCCNCTAGGRADRLYEEEHQRALEEQQRAIQASIDEAKESRHNIEDSVSISPMNVERKSPEKQYNSGDGDSMNLLLGLSGTPGIASAPPKPQPQINIDIPKKPDLLQRPWSSFSDQSASIQVVNQSPLQLHAAQSKTFMDEKKWGENAVQHGKSYQFAKGDIGVTLKRVSSKKYDGRLVDLETPRLKLVDLVNPADKTRPRNSSYEVAFEQTTTEL